MKILVLGGAGELGSNFSKLCIEMGHTIRIIDITRFYEATRLKELGIEDKVDYRWKSSFDLSSEDCSDTDILLDCACQADRPLGTSAPIYTLTENLFGPIHILETIVKMRNIHKNLPFIIYPSSSVEFLGVPKEEQPITEFTYPKPTNLYGYTKWAAEELYMTYHRAFKIPFLIFRTGSCYGPMMRTDQFIAQCIIKCLQKKDIRVKSPLATRTYTYTGDVMKFYKLFLEKFEKDSEQFNGVTIANGGNKEDKPYSTFEAAQLIQKLVGNSSNKIVPEDYEIGEFINGKPVYQWEKSALAYKILGWTPQYTLEDGLKETISWFRKKY